MVGKRVVYNIIDVSARGVLQKFRNKGMLCNGKT
jgi:hypothetical protein